VAAAAELGGEVFGGMGVLCFEARACGRGGGGSAWRRVFPPTPGSRIPPARHGSFRHCWTRRARASEAVLVESELEGTQRGWRERSMCCSTRTVNIHLILFLVKRCKTTTFFSKKNIHIVLIYNSYHKLRCIHT
jgi:hypothetical protein